MSVTITVWDGASTIGGNKILLEDGSAAVFLDFGLSFSTSGRFYAEFVNPRGVRGLYDPLTMGLLPRIQGIYREDLMPPEPLCSRMLPSDAPCVKAAGVLLSHAHADHIGCVSYLRPDIPVLCSPMTAFVTKAMQDSGKSDMQCEHCYAAPRVLKPDRTIVSAGKADRTQRPFRIVGSDTELSGDALDYWGKCYLSEIKLQTAPLDRCDEIEGLAIRCFPVDHSIYGATAFAVETSAGWVVYTGDLRTHGRNGHTTWTFAKEAAELNPIALICEGTHVLSEERPSEDQVQQNCLAEVTKAQGRLVIADFGARNVERLESFLRIARETGRLLVVTAKDAMLLKAMHLVDTSVPNPATDDTICLYDEPRGRSEGWLTAITNEMSSKLVAPELIRTSPGDYLLCFGFYEINELPELAPDNGGVYIHSSSELYNEEQVIDFQRLRNWLDYFGISLIGDPEDRSSAVRFHTSGHITGSELEALVRTVNPKTLIPVHTQPDESYEWFEEKFAADFRLELPRDNPRISL